MVALRLRQTYADSHAEHTGVALGRAEVRSKVQVVNTEGRLGSGVIKVIKIAQTSSSELSQLQDGIHREELCRPGFLFFFKHCQ